MLGIYLLERLWTDGAGPRNHNCFCLTVRTMAASGAASNLTKWASELAKGVHGYWANGRWKPLAISARHRAKIRKETLLAGGDWTYDAPRKEMKTVMKGHKVDRLAEQKRAKTAELMEKMPQMLAEMKKRRLERKLKVKTEK
ncbi:hypothetical protein R1flu_026848 [Riccia fluitans]|uniref:MRPL25 domain-containing protein n=1 Tax=Riccia fluitans TaxID=41844 RepID=A0ABD1XHM2_9MARC